MAPHFRYKRLVWLLFVTFTSTFISFAQAQTRVLEWNASGFNGGSGVAYSWSSSSGSNYRPVPWNSTINGGAFSVISGYVTLQTGFATSISLSNRNTNSGSGGTWGGGVVSAAVWNSSYLYFSFVVNSPISLRTLGANFRRSNLGPTAVNSQYSVNGSSFVSLATITSIGTGAGGTNMVTTLTSIPALTNLNVGDVVEFRFYLSGATETSGSTGNLYINGANALYLEIVGNPLPIKLNSFSVSCLDNGDKKVNWSTSSELNNDYFMVEKSLDAVNYTSIAKVAGAGNSNELLSYSIEDMDVSRNAYYRLTQYDYDGKSETFEPLFSKECAGQDHELRLLNMLEGRISVEIKTDENERCLLQIVNMSGQVLIQKQIDLNKGEQFVEMYTSSLSEGIYFVKAQFKDDLKVLKIIR